jgi:aspartate ammonia-lyase
MGFQGGAVRREHDLLGERDVRRRRSTGVQTLRALENFPSPACRCASSPPS